MYFDRRSRRVEKSRKTLIGKSAKRTRNDARRKRNDCAKKRRRSSRKSARSAKSARNGGKNRAAKVPSPRKS